MQEKSQKKLSNRRKIVILICVFIFSLVFAFSAKQLIPSSEEANGIKTIKKDELDNFILDCVQEANNDFRIVNNASCSMRDPYMFCRVYCTGSSTYELKKIITDTISNKSDKLKFEPLSTFLYDNYCRVYIEFYIGNNAGNGWSNNNTLIIDTDYFPCTKGDENYKKAIKF